MTKLQLSCGMHCKLCAPTRASLILRMPLIGCCADVKDAASMHPDSGDLLGGASAAKGVMIESLDLP